MKKYFLFFLSLFSSSSGHEYDLAVTCIFQNEGRFLKEWIEYHQKLGVQKFYLYNNNSTDDFEDILSEYINEYVVDLYNTNTDFSNEAEWVKIHVSSINHSLSISQSKWLISLDVDEFIFPQEKNNILDFLKDYEDYACVSACWVNFGTSNVYKIEENQLLKSLVYRAPLDFSMNKTVKSFIQTEKVKEFTTSHFALPKKGYLQVNEDKISFDGMVAPYFTANKIRINHYWTRDEKFLNEVKIPRRKKWGTEITPKMIENLNQVYDDSIKTFLDNNTD